VAVDRSGVQMKESFVESFSGCRCGSKSRPFNWEAGTRPLLRYPLPSTTAELLTTRPFAPSKMY